MFENKNIIFVNNNRFKMKYIQKFVLCDKTNDPIFIGQDTLFVRNNEPYFYKTSDPIFKTNGTLFLKKMWPYFYKKIDPIFMR